MDGGIMGRSNEWRVTGEWRVNGWSCWNLTEYK